MYIEWALNATVLIHLFFGRPKISSQVGGNEAWLLGFYLQTYGIHEFSN